MPPKKLNQPVKSEEVVVKEPPGCNIFCHMATHSHLPPVQKPIVWILGGPGVGKGTQCHKIVAKYGFTHLSTGDLLRDEVKTGSDLGKNIAGIIKRGELVPNDVVLGLVKQAIEKNKATSKGFLIDGYPREKSQGEAFEKTIAPASTILYFEAAPETMRQRILHRAANAKERRFDDTEEAIQIRLKTFYENNDRVLAQYPHKFKAINAERTVDEVFKDVGAVLDPIVSSLQYA
ncbi:adenylate kinase isoenzyme 1-like [Leguminivora glycinivorella]|uniref:adenylate kinase isoenzyme 1-like n=1 Tax=Leguminivora glycinivorella TaxID=1035111 RepID=UPI00200F4AF8|nr:adenylate kinase isoenzyme 1-like [Leguminivora glycinivorella]